MLIQRGNREEAHPVNTSRPHRRRLVGGWMLRPPLMRRYASRAMSSMRTALEGTAASVIRERSGSCRGPQQSPLYVIRSPLQVCAIAFRELLAYRRQFRPCIAASSPNGGNSVRERERGEGPNRRLPAEWNSLGYWSLEEVAFLARFPAN